MFLNLETVRMILTNPFITFLIRVVLQVFFLECTAIMTTKLKTGGSGQFKMAIQIPASL
jgi:hypothetical protein